MRVGGKACGLLLGLSATPALAENFTAIEDLARLATGYYVLPQSSVTPYLRDRPGLFRKVAALQPLALREWINLPRSDRYYLFPQCGRVLILQEQLISSNRGWVRLTCPQR
jgi:hypothetical protein